MLHGLYPPDLAEDWDNVGLQVGDPGAQVKRVLLALDPTEAAVETAQNQDCQVLLTHHPLILRPLHNVSPSDETGRVILSAIRNNLTLIAAHTNLDSAQHGLNDWLASRLDLHDCCPLSEAGVELVKLVVFVPRTHADEVAEAMFAAGAGHVGNYSHCSFRVEGQGGFRPGTGSQPFIGSIGEDERVDEVRIETILPRRLSTKVKEKMCRAHPYEEVAYDIYPLHNRLAAAGLGRIGRLTEETTLDAFAGKVKRELGVATLRMVGEPGRSVRKVAVCGGSGASLLAAADRCGADVLVTGDLKYHEARQAQQRGVAVLDAGHFATEQLAVAGLAESLARAAQARGLDLDFIQMEGERDPFVTL